MKKIVKLTTIILLLFFSNKAVFADTPHFLDFKLILNESDAGKKAQTFLKKKLEGGIKTLKSKEIKIQEEEKKNYTTKKSYICGRI